ncbi:MAG: 4Fe-4S binding protein [Thermoleophilia bacterium]|nr:4Fe-4S binding protein [Thermoleophilia bacterium]
MVLLYRCNLHLSVGGQLIHIDTDLCTGCGTCVDVCARGAVSLQNDTAVIDQELCTSCGRCVDVCPTEAIIPAETTEVVSAGAPGISQGRPAALLDVPPGEPAAPATPAPKQSMIKKVLFGLVGVAASALDNMDDRYMTTRSGSGRGGGARARGSGAGRGSGRRDGRGGGRGSGRGGGRGGGGHNRRSGTGYR